MTQHPARGAWNSRLGFILAASGSAIGLGNIVFFSSSAYQYGGGAFYLPYFAALFALGIPFMILKFGLGTLTGRALPGALAEVAGRKGEFVGWWAVGSTLFITMYYITILGWALGMMVGAFGDLFRPGVTAPFAPFVEPSAAPDATAYFFRMISSGWPLLAALAIWTLNLTVMARGTKSIERAVQICVPLMWVFMIGLVIRGLTLDGGVDGVLYLFTPDLRGIADPLVWRGAFSQMFFSLSLGLGAMTAYASYLPKRTDHVTNSLMVSFLNCGFEYIAGIAIFALLFAFALNPAGGTLTLSFFAVPQGLASLSWGVRLGGFLFFLLLIMAGLTSSISLIESIAAALIDKLGIGRGRALAMVAAPGIAGSLLFALPRVIDPGLAGNGTLGLTLLDVTDHWVFGYSLLTVGLLISLLVGWGPGLDRIREAVNAHTRFRLGRGYTLAIRFLIPLFLASALGWSLYEEFTRGSLYGTNGDATGYGWIPGAIPLLWIAATVAFAAFMAYGPSRSSVTRPQEPPPASASPESLQASA